MPWLPVQSLGRDEKPQRPSWSSDQFTRNLWVGPGLRYFAAKSETECESLTYGPQPHPYAPPALSSADVPASSRV